MRGDGGEDGAGEGKGGRRCAMGGCCRRHCWGGGVCLSLCVVGGGNVSDVVARKFWRAFGAEALGFMLKSLVGKSDDQC
jgi:hypothetical protein